MLKMDNIWIAYASNIKDIVARSGDFGPELRFQPNGFAQLLAANPKEEDVNDMYFNFVDQKALNDLSLGASNNGYFTAYALLVQKLLERTGTTTLTPAQQAEEAAARKAYDDAIEAWDRGRSLFKRDNDDFLDWAEITRKDLTNNLRVAFNEWLQSVNPKTRNLFRDSKLAQYAYASVQAKNRSGESLIVADIIQKCDNAQQDLDGSLSMGIKNGAFAPRYTSQSLVDLLKQGALNASFEVTHTNETEVVDSLKWDAKADVNARFGVFFSVTSNTEAGGEKTTTNKTVDNWRLTFKGGLRRLQVNPGGWHDLGVLNIASTHHLSLKHPDPDNPDIGGVAAIVDSVILGSNIELELQATDTSFQETLQNWHVNQHLGCQIGPFNLGGGELNVNSAHHDVQKKGDTTVITIAVPNETVVLGFLYKSTFNNGTA
jgi:hypothetical protein